MLCTSLSVFFACFCHQVRPLLRVPLMGLRDFEGLPLTLVFFANQLASSCVVSLDFFWLFHSTWLVDHGCLAFPLPCIFVGLIF